MTQMNKYKLYIMMLLYFLQYMQDGRKDSYCITTDNSDNAFIPRLPFQVFFFLVRLMFLFALEFISFIFKSRRNLRKLKSSENTVFFHIAFSGEEKKKPYHNFQIVYLRLHSFTTKLKFLCMMCVCVYVGLLGKYAF